MCENTVIYSCFLPFRRCEEQKWPRASAKEETPEVDHAGVTICIIIYLYNYIPIYIYIYKYTCRYEFMYRCISLDLLA